MQMIKIYPGDKNGGFESCTADSFSKLTTESRTVDLESSLENSKI